MARHLATVGLLGGAFCALWSVGETLGGWYLMEPPSCRRRPINSISQLRSHSGSCLRASIRLQRGSPTRGSPAGSVAALCRLHRHRRSAARQRREATFDAILVRAGSGVLSRYKTSLPQPRALSERGRLTMRFVTTRGEFTTLRQSGHAESQK
jgi:hypothetical protein